MKAKLYIGIIMGFMLTGLSVNAQMDYAGDFRNDDAIVVVNNYYDNYDYYYSSRINRFHRSYTDFNYYAPVYTDAYWYNYQPLSWGISIYSYSPGWYNPYFGSSYYWGYDPFYYTRWYIAPVVNVRIGHGWPNYYYGYYGHDHHYNHNYYNYGSGHNNHNNYYNNNYYNNNYYNNNYYSTRNSS